MAGNGNVGSICANRTQQKYRNVFFHEDKSCPSCYGKSDYEKITAALLYETLEALDIIRPLRPYGGIIQLIDKILRFLIILL